jgi:3-oxoacyl-[acyl-carrier protein] reductase
MFNNEFAGKVVLITGGGNGIGRGTALCFAEAGAKVAITGYREESINNTLGDLKKISDDAIAILADITKKDDCYRAVKETIDKFGRLDILVNNAGNHLNDENGLPVKPLAVTEEGYDFIMNVNLKGHFIMSQAAIPHMIEQNFGRIINIGSVTAIGGTYSSTPYIASKAGIQAMTMSLARHFGKNNILVNCIAPGMILTAMHKTTAQSSLDHAVSNTAIGRPGYPEDIAYAVMFFAGEKLYATGQTLIVDGGSAMK